MEIKYSVASRLKLEEIKNFSGKSTVEKIVKKIDGLAEQPFMGPSIGKLVNVTSPYRFLYVCRRFVFYRVKNDYVLVIDIFHEKENFLSRLFGISLRTQESRDYWGE